MQGNGSFPKYRALTYASSDCPNRLDLDINREEYWCFCVAESATWPSAIAHRSQILRDKFDSRLQTWLFPSVLFRLQRHIATHTCMIASSNRTKFMTGNTSLWWSRASTRSCCRDTHFRTGIYLQDRTVATEDAAHIVRTRWIQVKLNFQQDLHSASHVSA